MSTTGIRVGVFFDARGESFAPRREAWKIADDAGFDHLWHDDHLLTLAGGRAPDGPINESWTLLAAMAEATERVKVGVLVSSLQYRNPGMLAKMASTVDHISGGRLEVAMGAGWSKRELASLGMPFVGRPERIDMFDEACQVLKLLWTQARTDFEGTYYRLTDAISEPKPLQDPHPRLWIGAEAKRTLLVAARYADVWNMPMGDPDADREVSRILDEHCEAIGRDPAEITCSANVRLNELGGIGPGAELAARYEEAGVDLVIFNLPQPFDPAVLEPLADAVSARG
jgi:F420-dependent oxidoreductase-like protein